MESAAQPPSGGCVLKPHVTTCNNNQDTQPPSGGCVLKLTNVGTAKRSKFPAAFRRLCVETTGDRYTLREPLPAAFRRLCVETTSKLPALLIPNASRLQAAVC